jgi:hypothetical protein
MFAGETYWSTSLVQVDLPGRTLRLCEGADTRWGAESYVTDEADFGSLLSGELGSEGESEFAPGGLITLNPRGGVAAAVLSNPAMQGSGIKIWLAEISGSTGLVIGTPELLFSGFVDVPRLRRADGKRILELGFVSGAERLFRRNRGNTMSTRFHETVWAGELGFENATGVQISVAWGVDAPPRGSSNAAAFTGGRSFLSAVGFAR